MAALKRIATVLAAVVLVAVIVWTSSQSVRGLVTGFIWDRDSTLQCTGGVQGDRIRLSDESIDSRADPLIYASGGCRLTIRDSELLAPTAIVADGNAVITIEGGTIRGKQAALEVGGRAVVILDGVQVEGEVKVEGDGRVEGQGDEAP